MPREPREPKTLHNAGGQPETILLADDDADVREFVGVLLQREGYLVLEASGGREALRICAQYEGPIHLLLTDIQMPDMTGPELVPQALALRPHLPVLYMSAQFSEDILSQLEGRPLQPFIQKPFAPEALAQKMRDLLDPSAQSPPA